MSEDGVNFSEGSKTQSEMCMQICSFCGTRGRASSFNVNLVYHPQEGNGVSYGCDDCVKSVPEIRINETNKSYYYWPEKKPFDINDTAVVDANNAGIVMIGDRAVDITTGEVVDSLVFHGTVDELNAEEPGFDTEGLSLGQKLETAFDLKWEMDALEDKIKVLKSEYEFLQREILSEMADKDLNKIECTRGSASYKVEPYPNLVNHMEFFTWVAKTERFEFLEKRCSRSAIKDMLATEGVLPPGIDTYMKESISIRKKPVRRAK